MQGHRCIIVDRPGNRKKQDKKNKLNTPVFVSTGKNRKTCNGIALNNLRKAGNYLGTGIGIVLVLLGSRILDGKPGVPGRGTSPDSVVHRAKKGIKLLSPISR